MKIQIPNPNMGTDKLSAGSYQWGKGGEAKKLKMRVLIPLSLTLSLQGREDSGTGYGGGRGGSNFKVQNEK